MSIHIRQRILLINEPEPDLSNRNIVLAILLLAGDVYPNPGPINREAIYPCDYCQQHVGWSCSGVGCETCNVWYHRECVSITHVHTIWLFIIRLMFGFVSSPRPQTLATPVFRLQDHQKLTFILKTLLLFCQTSRVRMMSS